MSAEPIAAEARTYSEPGIPQELIGVSRSMERLMASLEELAHLVPVLDARLSPVLVDAGQFPSGARISEGKAPLRCGLAESIEIRASQVDDIVIALRGVLERVDL